MALTFFSPPRRPPNEPSRQAAVDKLRLLDGPGDPAFDAIVQEAAAALGLPIAAISLIDRDRQWFLARVGLDATETPRAVSFCGHGILQPEVLVVPDATRDPRFAGNPLVTDDPDIRFYAGAPLVTGDGQALGALCVIGPEPRAALSESERGTLTKLAAKVVALLEARLADQPSEG